MLVYHFCFSARFLAFLSWSKIRPLSLSSSTLCQGCSSPARPWALLFSKSFSLKTLDPLQLYSSFSPSAQSSSCILRFMEILFSLSFLESLCSKKLMQNRKIMLPSFSFSSFPVQVLVQPQIIKTDSLVLTTLKTDGSPVMATVQNPALTALTAPLQTAAPALKKNRKTV